MPEVFDIILHKETFGWFKANVSFPLSKEHVFQMMEMRVKIARVDNYIVNISETRLPI